MGLVLVFFLIIIIFICGVSVVKSRMYNLRIEIINEIGDELEKIPSEYSTRELVEIRQEIYAKRLRKRLANEIPDGVIPDLNTIFVFEND